MERLVFLLIFASSVSLNNLAVAKSKGSYRKTVKKINIFKLPDNINKTYSLRSFLAKVISDNIEIKNAHFDSRTAEESYDQTMVNLHYPTPVINASLSENRAGSSKTSDSVSAGMSMSGSSDWGVNYSLKFPDLSESIAGEKGDNNDKRASISMGASLSVDLLKNSAFFVGGNQAKSADINLKTSRQTLRQQILAKVYEAENSFYQVFKNQANVHIATNALASVIAIDKDTKLMYKAGTKAKSDVIQTEMQVKQSEISVVNAKRDYKNSLETLKEILNTKELIYPDPSSLKNIPKKPQFIFDEIYTQALKRPDYLQAKWQVEQAQMSLESSYSNTFPALDFQVNVSRSRNGKNLSTLIKSPFDLDKPSTSFTLNFTMDVFRWNDKQRYRASLNSLERQKLSIKNLENQIKKELKSGLISVEAAYNSFALAKSSKELSEQKLEMEHKKFNLGQTSIKTVIDFQNETNSAISNELSAMITVISSLANLRRSQGLLPANL